MKEDAVINRIKTCCKDNYKIILSSIIAVLFVAVVVLLGFYILNYEKNSDDKEVITQTLTSNNDTEKITSQDREFRVIKTVRNYTTKGFEDESDDKEYIKVLIDLRNTGEDSFTYSDKDFVIKEGDKTRDCLLLRIDTDVEEEGVLNNDQYIQGFAVFEINQNTDNLIFVYNPENWEKSIEIKF